MNDHCPTFYNLCCACGFASLDAQNVKESLFEHVSLIVHVALGLAVRAGRF